MTRLDVPLDLAVQEAATLERIPEGSEWVYEPKWDGFRCLAFRDGDDVHLVSKAGKPLGRYFPDVVGALRALRATRFVLDGEIVVPEGDRLSFEQLLQRIHPAASRVHRLAQATPAQYVVFDLLQSNRGGRIDTLPFRERRARLETFAAQYFTDDVLLSPQSAGLETAHSWLGGGEDGLDGVMAKRADEPYRGGERTAMTKIKRFRTADCVVGGFRYGTRSREVGSLLLGLYDGDGVLHHVGFTSSLRADERKAVTTDLEALAGGTGFTGRAPGGPSRWSTERSAEWVPLEPRLVVEVRYDHFSEGRFRHGTRFERWRPDKAPRQCTFDQLPPEGRPALRLLRSG